MYKIRFTNSKGETVITTISNKKDFDKIANTAAKNSVVDTKINSGMSVALHNHIAKHNAKIRTA